jgi:hypothetical protein
MGKMRNKVAIISFLWGDWPAQGLGIDYVNRLRNSLLRNVSQTFDFICYVDHPLKIKALMDIGVEGRFIAFPESTYRWNLKKISMFRESAELQSYEWVVALDLDIVISNNVDFLLAHRSKRLVTCRAAYSDDIGGSVVGFAPRAYWCKPLTEYLRQCYQDIEACTGGSERKFYRKAVDLVVIPKVEYWQDAFPGKVVSYKVDGFRKNASVIRFHGDPRPHEVVPTPGWIEDNWV